MSTFLGIALLIISGFVNGAWAHSFVACDCRLCFDVVYIQTGIRRGTSRILHALRRYTNPTTCQVDLFRDPILHIMILNWLINTV